MKRVLIIILSSAILLFGACSHDRPGQLPPSMRPLENVQADELIRSRKGQASEIAKMVENSMLGIKEEPTQATVRISLAQLKRTSGGTYNDGYIAIHLNGHTYRIYLLLSGACVRPIVDPHDRVLELIITQIPKPAIPGELIEGGRYRVYMVEDDLITWAWDLRPAFKDAELPETGGFDPGEAFLVSETQRRLRGCR